MYFGSLSQTEQLLSESNMDDVTIPSDIFIPNKRPRRASAMKISDFRAVSTGGSAIIKCTMISGCSRREVLLWIG